MDSLVQSTFKPNVSRIDTNASQTFPKIEQEGTFPNSFYEVIILPSYQNQDITGKL